MWIEEFVKVQALCVDECSTHYTNTLADYDERFPKMSLSSWADDDLNKLSDDEGYRIVAEAQEAKDFLNMAKRELARLTNQLKKATT